MNTRIGEGLHSMVDNRKLVDKNCKSSLHYCEVENPLQLHKTGCKQGHGKDWECNSVLRQ